VLFGASISRGKTLLPKRKGSPSALLPTWYRKKGIEESLRTPAHWLNLYFGDFRFYFTWYCTFMSAITFKLMSVNYISGCSNELSCRKLSSLRFTAFQATLHMFLVGPLLLLFLFSLQPLL
jgi:hypothetical protein